MRCNVFFFPEVIKNCTSILSDCYKVLFNLVSSFLFYFFFAADIITWGNTHEGLELDTVLLNELS